MKIALLIDADNISHRILPQIIEQVSRQGQIALQVIYGDWGRQNLQRWHEIALENDFKIRHQTNARKSKNATDMKLIMDAMEILHFVPVDAFCLVTNDADYVPLCDKLRESKKYIIGVGYPTASQGFIRSCDQFIFIRHESPAVVNEQPPAISDEAKEVIVRAFELSSQNGDEWVDLSILGALLRKVQPSFKTKHYGHGNLSKLLKSMPDVIELQANGSVKSARLRQ